MNYFLTAIFLTLATVGPLQSEEGRQHPFTSMLTAMSSRSEWKLEDFTRKQMIYSLKEDDDVFLLIRWSSFGKGEKSLKQLSEQVTQDLEEAPLFTSYFPDLLDDDDLISDLKWDGTHLKILLKRYQPTKNGKLKEFEQASLSFKMQGASIVMTGFKVPAKKAFYYQQLIEEMLQFLDGQ